MLEIRAPADQTEGTRSQVLRWLKNVGEAVAEHEPLIEIETDKVTVEVAAPAAGVLREIVKGEQDEIAPGELLGRMEIGEGETQAGMPAPVEAVTSALGKPIASAEPHASAERSPRGEASSQPITSPRLSPAVRRLMTERGLDPATVEGTGEGGRITVDDVLAAHATTPTTRTSSPKTPATINAPPVAVAPTFSRSHLVPHTAIRKRIASHMVNSLLHTAPHVTTVFEVDLTAVQAHRATDRSVTLTAYFIAAAVQAIRAVPEANSRWTDAALELYDDIHIGIATAIEDGGLVVPVLQNVEALDLQGIASELSRLVTAAREGKLDPSDVRGGTFTISNHGVSGSLLATPIVINQPQSAILGIGKLEKRPVVIECEGDEQLVIRPKCYVTLTIDHRVMDGHQANHFLQVFVRTLESWPAT